MKLLLAATAHGQDPPTQSSEEDSIPRYSLGEIVVTGTASRPGATAYTRERISLADIARTDAAVVSDFAQLVPAAHVQTNSRGETLVYLRNAGERQVGVFFEGALLNVPWDNRVDISLVPATVIGGMTVAKGVPPIEYGTNVLGGAVNFTARSAEFPWSETEVVARFGTQERVLGSLTHRGRAGRVSYAAAISYTTIDGLSLSPDALLPYNQTADDIRTNTDSRVTNLFASGIYDFDSGARIGLSLVHMDARKGVAPEGHLNPALSRVRYWRYPDWRYSAGILSTEGMIGGNTAWKGAAWVNTFDQALESYGSLSYEQVVETEENDDFTIGARFTLAHTLGPGIAKLAFNGLTSTHDQQDIQLDASGNPVPGEEFPLLTYQQHIMSLGGEYTLSAGPSLQLSAGASLDAIFTPKTGDKPARDPFVDFTATLGASYDIGSAWFIRGSVGRKTRFPTMRELFGDALNRFVINPDLQPESSILAEVGVGVQHARYSGEIIPFANFTSGTIDQISILVEGETQNQRMRVNLEGSRIIGVEMVGTALPADYLTLEAHLTVMDVVRRQDTPLGQDKLSEKPEVLARVAAILEARTGTSGIIETVYTGRAYSPNDDNVFVPLNTSFVINLRVAQDIFAKMRRTFEVFARVDNLTDVVVLPQLGLPAAGRTASAGVRVVF